MVTTTYTYDRKGNRLTSVGSTSLTYDGSGQMTAYGSTTYAWNIENQLASVTTASGTDTYTYDSLGRRATIDGVAAQVPCRNLGGLFSLSVSVEL